MSALGEPLGQTDERGLYLASLRGAVGETVELKVTCPEGYRSPTVPLSVRLRASSIRDQRPEYQVLCPPLIRRLLVAVRTVGVADLPVKVLGAEIARTDAQGAAHALLAVAPGDTVLVELDSSGVRHAGLMPHNPELRIVMPEHDEVVLFDQTFTRPPLPRRKRAPKEPVGPQPI